MHPLLARRIILPLHERLLGRPSFRLLRELQGTQWWSPAQIRRLQADKLRAVVRHAHERCPYYRRLFREAGVDIDALDLDSLTGLPTLSRRDVGDHAEEMVDRSVRGGLHRMSTGGSTGVPVRFYVDRLRQAAGWAARARARAGSPFEAAQLMELDSTGSSGAAQDLPTVPWLDVDDPTATPHGGRRRDTRSRSRPRP